ncbi:MAG: carbonate dehydratase [Candidatus Omnitrophica bacterium]|nr:carbonate dehydratase [Candidatus Omnitrophota bacterium]
MANDPKRGRPRIDKGSYIHPTAVIIGNVKIGKKVFVAPGAVIRADEPGSSIFIEDCCNIQDRVIIHGLEGSRVLIKERTSVAHGAIVHGPCIIGENCFIGFGSIVFDADIGNDVIIKHSVVIEKSKIPPSKIADSGMIISGRSDADRLRDVDQKTKEFAENVIKVNLELARSYQDT